jgi:hypothetical protein
MERENVLIQVFVVEEAKILTYGTENLVCALWASTRQTEH